jgi:hypothetical protein
MPLPPAYRPASRCCGHHPQTRPGDRRRSHLDIRIQAPEQPKQEYKDSTQGTQVRKQIGAADLLSSGDEHNHQTIGRVALFPFTSP